MHMLERVSQCEQPTGSLRAYRLHTFYDADVDITIQTVIQTVGIYGTDVQTVGLLKARVLESLII